MPPITWRNIDAPDFSSAANILQQGTGNIQNALTNLGAMADQQVQRDTAANTAALMEGIRQNVTDTNSYNAYDLNQAAQQYGQYVDKNAALDMLLGLRPSFQQADQAAAANQAAIQTAQIKAQQANQKDQFNKQLQFEQSKAATADLEAQQVYDKAVQKIGKIDEGLRGDSTIGDSAQLIDKWVTNTINKNTDIFGGYYGSKDPLLFGTKFKEELLNLTDWADKQQAKLAESKLGKEQGKIYDKRTSAELMDYVLTTLPTDSDGGVKLSDFKRQYNKIAPRFLANLAKIKAKQEQENILAASKLANRQSLDKAHARLLGRK